MDMQNVSNLQIPEGAVRTIHDKDNRLIWGRLAYETKYAGDTYQQRYSGKNLISGIRGTIGERQVNWKINTANLASNIFYLSFIVNANLSSTNRVYVKSDASTVVKNCGALTATSGVKTAFAITLTDAELSSFKNGSEPLIQLYENSTSIDYTTLSFTEVMVSVENDGIFEPYVGGIPSPNPDYPQDVQVATGIQTISITDSTNTQNFTVNLGSIELCKIGSYQDYIYKSGDDWYVHKECEKVVLNGTSEGTWTYNSSAGHERFIVNYSPIALQTPYASDTPKIQWSNYFTGSNGYHTYTGDLDNIISGHNNNHQIVVRATQFTSLDAFKNWLSGHNVTVYYALATSTSTKITDPTLISQLDNIHQFLTRYGYDATASGNLPIIVDRTNL